MNTAKSLQTISCHLERIYYLQSIEQQLKWDENVNMPSGSIRQRSSELAVIAKIIQTALSNDELHQHIQLLLENKEQLSTEEQAITREAKKSVSRARKLPADFFEKQNQSQSQAHNAWLKARKERDFNIFAPHLKRQIELCTEEASILAPEKDPYDYWVDVYNPGMDSQTIDTLFDELKIGLLPVVQEALEQAQQDVPEFGEFRDETLMQFIKDQTTALGFDYSKGRLDLSPHPFCGGNQQDTRLTTRLNATKPLEGILAGIHEAGHGMYQQGLPSNHLGTALSNHAGMAIHESQSRLWENQIGRSKPFWKYWEPKLRAKFKKPMEPISFHDLLIHINIISPTPIRVYADELHYNLHIIHRFELEKQLLKGTLQVNDLPEKWNQLSKEIIGAHPKNPLEGVLQDIHWAFAGFGYYPSYCLGNMIAAQLWTTLNNQIPNINQQLETGDYSQIFNWLNQNIHQSAHIYQTQDLVKKASQAPISPKPLLAYLKKRYLKTATTLS